MATLFESGAALLAETVRTQGVQAVYSRNGLSVTIVMCPAMTGNRGEGEPVTLRSRTRDWKIAVADLVLNGEATEPAEGDTIRVTAASAVEVYRVCGLNQGACFERDPTGTMYRVHSELTDVEDLP